MPRISCAVTLGYPHHITHRGNYWQTVFEDESFVKRIEGVVGKCLIAMKKGNKWSLSQFCFIGIG